VGYKSRGRNYAIKDLIRTLCYKKFIFFFGAILMALNKSSVVATFVLFLPVSLAAEEFKFRNPHPVLKPIPLEDALRLAPVKLGEIPKFSENQWTDLIKGEAITRELPSEKDEGKRFETMVIVPACPHDVMTRLMDYGSFVGMMPNLKELEFSWNGNLARVKQKIQAGLFKFTYWMNILHYGDSFIEWEFVEGDIRDTSGYYKLFPLDEGTKTLLIYHVYSDPGIWVPQFIQDMITKGTMPGVVRAIRDAVVDNRKKDEK